MHVNPYIANRMWIASMRRRFGDFCGALDRTGITQRDYLMRLLKRNKHTEYGRRYGFSRIGCVEEYRKQVPLTGYEDYGEYIRKIADGRSNVLCSDKITLFEPTSGSISASKLIPYNAQLKREFNNAVAPWMYSLYTNNPALFRGRSYWSVSPSVLSERSSGRIKVGFDSDSEYLGFWARHLYNMTSAVPSGIAAKSGLDDFRNNTLARLLLCRDLSFISVWNPTFMILLLEHFLSNYEEVIDIAENLHNGRRSPRIRELKSLISGDVSKAVFQRIWPMLSVISCWTDGLCGRLAGQLRKYFPSVKMQGKGLIATEAFVSLPFVSNRDPVLAVNSHFFEFIDERTSRIFTADRLQVGQTYSVAVTTGGGLYRYRLNDIVEVTGFVKSAPTFRFISKSNSVSDLSGEKLNESHVMNCFESAFRKHSLKPEYYLFAPISRTKGTLRYCVYFQGRNITEEKANEFLFDFDTMLRENYHYDYCRKLGQISCPSIFVIENKAKETYHFEMLRRGMKFGDIKPVCLDREFGWDKLFSGRLID